MANAKKAKELLSALKLAFREAVDSALDSSFARTQRVEDLDWLTSWFSLSADEFPDNLNKCKPIWDDCDSFNVNEKKFRYLLIRQVNTNKGVADLYLVKNYKHLRHRIERWYSFALIFREQGIETFTTLELLFESRSADLHGNRERNALPEKEILEKSKKVRRVLRNHLDPASILAIRASWVKYTEQASKQKSDTKTRENMSRRSINVSQRPPLSALENIATPSSGRPCQGFRIESKRYFELMLQQPTNYYGENRFSNLCLREVDSISGDICSKCTQCKSRQKEYARRAEKAAHNLGYGSLDEAERSGVYDVLLKVHGKQTYVEQQRKIEEPSDEDSKSILLKKLSYVLQFLAPESFMFAYLWVSSDYIIARTQGRRMEWLNESKYGETVFYFFFYIFVLPGGPRILDCLIGAADLHSGSGGKVPEFDSCKYNLIVPPVKTLEAYLARENTLHTSGIAEEDLNKGLLCLAEAGKRYCVVGLDEIFASKKQVCFVSKNKSVYPVGLDWKVKEPKDGVWTLKYLQGLNLENVAASKLMTVVLKSIDNAQVVPIGCIALSDTDGNDVCYMLWEICELMLKFYENDGAACKERVKLCGFSTDAASINLNGFTLFKERINSAEHQDLLNAVTIRDVFLFLDPEHIFKSLVGNLIEHQDITFSQKETCLIPVLKGLQSGNLVYYDLETKRQKTEPLTNFLDVEKAVEIQSAIKKLITLKALDDRDKMWTLGRLSLVSTEVIEVLETEGIKGEMDEMVQVLKLFNTVYYSTRSFVGERTLETERHRLKNVQTMLTDWYNRCDKNLTASHGRRIMGFISTTTYKNTLYFLEAIEAFIVYLEKNEHFDALAELELRALSTIDNETLHSLIRARKSDFTIKEGKESYRKSKLVLHILYDTNRGFWAITHRNKQGSYEDEERTRAKYDFEPIQFSERSPFPFRSCLYMSGDTVVASSKEIDSMNEYCSDELGEVERSLAFRAITDKKGNILAKRDESTAPIAKSVVYKVGKAHAEKVIREMMDPTTIDVNQIALKEGEIRQKCKLEPMLIQYMGITYKAAATTSTKLRSLLLRKQ